MTARRITDETEIPEDAEIIDGDSDDITELQATLDDEIASLIGEFGGDELDNDWKIHVKRVVPKQGVLEHCFSAVPSELPILERIKDEYGPGAYTIYILNKNRLRKKPTIRIAEPLRKRVADTMASNGREMSTLIATMMEQQQKQMEQMQRIFERTTVQPVQTQADPTQMMIGIMSAMRDMKEFMTPSQQGNPVELLIEGVKLANEIGGKNGESNLHDTLLGLANQFGPPLLAMAAQEKENPSNPRPANQPIGKQPMNAQPNAQPVDPAFAQQLGMLVQKASTNADPGLYADLICDNANSEQIAVFIQRPDLIEHLGSINPGVLQHRDWFEKLKAEILSILTGSEEDAIQPELNPEMDQTHEAGGVGDFTENT